MRNEQETVRILVVDDAPVIGHMCVRVLSPQGYQVHEAHSGQEALDRLARESFDLLLLDLLMPEVDGLIVLRRARELDPYVVAIIITGHGSIETAIGALRAGARGFLSKPFTPAQLRQTVAEALEMRRQEQENLFLRARLPILEISQTLARGRDADILAGQLLEAVAQQVRADQVALLLLDKQTDELELIGAIGLTAGAASGTRVPVGAGLARQALARDDLLVIEGAATPDPLWPVLAVGADAHIVCVPLRIMWGALGLLVLSRASHRAPFTPGELNLLSIVSSPIATALENARLFAVVARGKREWEVTFDAMTDGIALIDADFRILRANRTLAGWLGTTPQALTGRLCYEWLHHLDAPSAFCVHCQMMQSKQPQSMEMALPAREGTFLISADPLLDERGELTASVHVFRDITARKQAEEALRQRNRELALLNHASRAINATLDLEQVLATILEEIRHLLSATACSVWLLEPEGGELVCQHSIGPQAEMVRGWRLALGQGLAGWAAQNGESLIVPDAPADERYFQGVDERTGIRLRSIISVPLRRREDVIGVLQVTDTAAARFSLADLTLVESMAAAATTAIVNARLFQQAQQEIAERERAEAALHRRNEELAALNRVAVTLSRPLDLGGMLHDALCTVMDVSQTQTGAVWLLDEGSEALVLTAAQNEPPGFRERFGTIPWGEGIEGQVAATGEPALIEDIGTIAEISVMADEYQSLACIPLQSKGQALGVMSVGTPRPQILDAQTVELLVSIGSQIGMAIENARLTEEAAEVEILRELERLRSEFIANVSHELRTPLGLIKIFSSSLLMEDMGLDRETQWQFLRGIEEEADNLEELVDNLLELSRRDSGRLHMDWRPTDIGQLARAVAESLQAQLTPRHRLAYDLPADPLWANVDPQHMERVLRNLLSNAIKYSPAGGTITIHGHGDERRVEIAIRDEGIGIPMEEQELIFERFYRIQNEATQRTRGIGLGLAVCREILEAHGGHIGVESSPGAGSTFRFTLPVDAGAEPAAADPGAFVG